jgi:catalase (peroxidase I)
VNGLRPQGEGSRRSSTPPGPAGKRVSPADLIVLAGGAAVGQAKPPVLETAVAMN